MIDKTRFAEIRRLFFAEHLSVDTIAAQVGVHHAVVRRAVGTSAFNQRKVSPARPSVLDPYKGFVDETLARYPKLRATRLFEMLQSRGYTGSVVVLRRYMATVRKAPKREAFLRRETLMGEEGQVDWAHFGKRTIGHGERPLVCFVLVLGYSRAVYARFYHDLGTDSFLDGHVRAFEALGGVPRRLLYDNLKSAVIERVGDAIRFNERLLSLAAHYHFEPRVCAPYRGNEKGKVERKIRFLRERFFAARDFSDLTDLNRQLDAWITEVAHRQPAPGDAQRRTIQALLEEERPKLLPLPDTAFPVERVVQLRSGNTPYLRFDRNDYSIPHALVGRALVLRASASRVRIFDPEGKLAAEHERSYATGDRIEDPTHINALRAQKRHAGELRGRSELVKKCPNAAKLLAALADQDRPMAREIRTLLLLCDRYGDPAVDEAIATTLEKGGFSAYGVELCLDDARKARGLRPAVAGARTVRNRSPQSRHPTPKKKTP